MTTPIQSVSVRRAYYGSGTPPVLPVLYDDQYDSNPNLDVLDPVLQYDGARGVIGYTWNGIRQVENSDPIGDALRSSAVAYWKMDEAAGQNLIDATGRGNTLTETGGSIDSVSGLVGNAKNFEGNNRYFKHDDNADLRFLNSWALSCLISFNNITASKFIVVKEDGDLGPVECEFYLGNANGRISGYCDEISFSGSIAITSSSVQSVDTWYAVVLQYNDITKTMSIYINNVNRGEATELGFTPATKNVPFLVGIWADESSLSLNAKLQHLAKYSRVLTTDEIAYLYNSGAGRTLYP